MQVPAAWHSLSSAQARALVALGTMLLIAQIGQPFPETARLHHLPTLALLFAAPLLLQRWPMSDGAVVAAALFFALHTLGGRYTYSSVPYDDWSRWIAGLSLGEGLGWSRNHYDRLVHFAFGLLFYAPIREIAARHMRQPRGQTVLMAFGFVLAIGALYEMFEALLTLTVPADVAADYNGQQGDPWDAQKDMGLAFTGALIAAGWMRGRTRWRG